MNDDPIQPLRDADPRIDPRIRANVLTAFDARERSRSGASRPRRPRTWLRAAVVAIVAAGLGFVVGRGTSSSTGTAAAPTSSVVEIAYEPAVHDALGVRR